MSKIYHTPFGDTPEPIVFRLVNMRNEQVGGFRHVESASVTWTVHEIATVEIRLPWDDETIPLLIPCDGTVLIEADCNGAINYFVPRKIEVQGLPHRAPGVTIYGTDAKAAIFTMIAGMPLALIKGGPTPIGKVYSEMVQRTNFPDGRRREFLVKQPDHATAGGVMIDLPTNGSIEGGTILDVLGDYVFSKGYRLRADTVFDAQRNRFLIHTWVDKLPDERHAWALAKGDFSSWKWTALGSDAQYLSITWQIPRPDNKKQYSGDYRTTKKDKTAGLEYREKAISMPGALPDARNRAGGSYFDNPGNDALGPYQERMEMEVELSPASRYTVGSRWPGSRTITPGAQVNVQFSENGSFQQVFYITRIETSFTASGVFTVKPILQQSDRSYMNVWNASANLAKTVRIISGKK
jgi:hypothetical protein